MSSAKHIYEAHVGHTHEKAVVEVYKAGYNAGLLHAAALEPVKQEPEVGVPTEPEAEAMVALSEDFEKNGPEAADEDAN